MRYTLERRMKPGFGVAKHRVWIICCKGIKKKYGFHPRASYAARDFGIKASKPVLERIKQELLKEPEGKLYEYRMQRDGI